MNIYSWKVNTISVEKAVDGFNNVVKLAHYTVDAQANDGTTASSYGSVYFDTPSEESFVNYEDLTEEQVIEWVKNKVDSDKIESSLDKNIQDLQNLPSFDSTGPWASSN